MMVSIQKRININVHRIWTLNVTPFLRIFEWTLEASQEKVALKGRRQPTRPAPSRGGTFMVSIYDWCVQPGDKNELLCGQRLHLGASSLRSSSDHRWDGARCAGPNRPWRARRQAETSQPKEPSTTQDPAQHCTSTGLKLHTHTHTPVALLLSTRHARARSTVLIPLLACKHRF